MSTSEKRVEWMWIPLPRDPGEDEAHWLARRSEAYEKARRTIEAQGARVDTPHVPPAVKVTL